MEHEQIVKAIQHIYPDGADFTIRDKEIVWLDKIQTEPTQNQIEAGWISYQAKVVEDEAIAEAKKASAQAKLAALGLTTDDLKALGL